MLHSMVKRTELNGNHARRVAAGGGDIWYEARREDGRCGGNRLVRRVHRQVEQRERLQCSARGVPEAKPGRALIGSASKDEGRSVVRGVGDVRCEHIADTRRFQSVGTDDTRRVPVVGVECGDRVERRREVGLEKDGGGAILERNDTGSTEIARASARVVVAPRARGARRDEQRVGREQGRPARHRSGREVWLARPSATWQIAGRHQALDGGAAADFAR